MLLENASYFYFLLIPFFLILFSTLILLQKKSIYSLFDARVLTTFIISSSLTFLCLLVLVGLVDTIFLYKYLALHIITFFGVYISSNLYKLKKSYTFIENISEKFTQYKYFSLILIISFLINFMSQGFLSFTLQISGLGGSERLLLSKQFTIISFLNYSSFRIFCICISTFFAYYKRLEKHHVLQIFLIVLVNILSGSKSGMLGFGIIFLTFNKLDFKFNFRNISIWLIALISFGSIVIASIVVNSISIQDFFGRLVYDLLMRGDIYYMALVEVNLEKYYGEYNALSYFLHPFFLLFGSRGYDLPLGTKLLKDITGKEIGGANTHLTLLSDVLFQGNFLISFFFCFFVGFMTHIVRFVYQNIFYTKRIGTLRKIMLFIPVFFVSSIFTDPSVYAYIYIVSSMVFFFLISFIILIITTINRITQIIPYR